jgi:hypothetical protein
MRYIEHSSIHARIARVCDPRTATRYVIFYRAHDGSLVEMRNVLPGDCGRALEALKGQGFPPLWSGFMSDYAYGKRVAQNQLARAQSSNTNRRPA